MEIRKRFVIFKFSLAVNSAQTFVDITVFLAIN